VLISTQLRVAIEIFDILNPGDQAVFFFDCSAAHESLAPDALCARRMNVKPGGKQPVMHDTTIPLDNPHLQLRGQPQKLIFDENDAPTPELIGQPKGMARVLQERGLLRPRLPGTCADCRLSEAKRLKKEMEARLNTEQDGDVQEPHEPVDPANYPQTVDPSLTSCRPIHSRTDCCMTRILSLQTDFASEKSQIEAVIEAAGHRCLFLPKFHCELNPIEMYWGWSKRGK
jgi:hypothetical protein